MARKGLPKKYAKMGFKKGWAAYKRSKNKGKRKRKSTKKRASPKRRRRSTMARRKSYRRSRTTSVSLTDMGYAIALADHIGLVDAGITLYQGGDLRGAVDNVRNKAGDISTYVNIGLTTAIYGVTKKIFGGRTLISFGKFRIRT